MSGSTPKFTVCEINDLDALDVYRAAWRRLLDETPRGSFFQSLDWLEVYWRHFGKHQNLRVLVVLDDDGAPAGILPLVVRWETTKLGRLRFLTYPLDYWGSFYGPVGPKPQAVLEAGLKHILASRCDWDGLELRWAGQGDFDTAAASQTLASRGLPSSCTLIDQTALIRLEGRDWDAYLAERTSKWRNNYRRWERRAAELGELDLVRYSPLGQSQGDGDPRWDLYDACVHLAERSWQGASQTGTTLSHASVREFLRDMHGAAARAGGLDLNILTAGGTPIAFAYNYCHRGYVFGLRVGYDEQHSRYALGNVIYSRVIEDSFRRGDKVYDMGPGSIEAKQALLTEVHPVLRYSHFRRSSLRGQVLRLKRTWDSQQVTMPVVEPAVAGE